MKEQKLKALAQASPESSVQIELPILEVPLQTKAELEAFTAEAGLGRVFKMHKD